MATAGKGNHIQKRRQLTTAEAVRTVKVFASCSQLRVLITSPILQAGDH